MPFKSEKQRRYLFANEPEIAKDWTETYGSKIKKAQGGRIGYYSGGQSIPSEYTVEDARKTAMQDRLGGITEVMKQADLYRQGDIGQMYMANGGITRLGYRYGGDTMGGPNDRSSKSGASAPAGGASAGGNYGGNRNPDQSYGGGDVGSLGITGAQPANVFTDVTKDFLNPQKDYFTQTYSGQPNFLGFGGGYRTLKTPNDAGSNYRSRLNPIGLMSLLGRSFSMPFTLAASGFNSLRDTLGTGINTLRNKFGPAFNTFKDSGNFQEFLRRMKTGETITNPAVRGEYVLPAIEQEGYTDEDLEGIKDQESFLPSVIVQALAAAKSGASTKKIGEIILQNQIRKEMEKKMIKDPRSLIG